MDSYGNTIVAKDAADARRKLADAERGLSVAGVTITLWINGRLPYDLHLDWKTFASLVAVRATDAATDSAWNEARASVALDRDKNMQTQSGADAPKRE